MSLGLNSNIQPNMQPLNMQPGMQYSTQWQAQPGIQPGMQAQSAAMPYKEPDTMAQFSPQMSAAAQIQALQANQMKQLEQLNKLSAQNAYGAQYNAAQTPADIQTTAELTAEQPTGQAPDGQLITENQGGEILNNQNQNAQNPDVQMDETLKNALHAPFDSSLNAQMPAPEIKNGKGPVQNGQSDATLENNNQNKNYKELPHLNVGVVDGPSKHSKTPVTDSLNRKAAEKPKTKLPAATNKKSFTAGSLSNLCALGAFGIVTALFAPKGISKILKLIKHK